MSFSYSHAVQDIIAAGRRLDALHLAPATGGNYSMRTGDDEMAITVSGAHKGRLTETDIMRADLNGAAIDDKKPSAETLLHCGIYKLFPDVRAVLHTHSVPLTVLTRVLGTSEELTLAGYEMLKAYPGVHTHDTKFSLPIFDNTQDMVALSADVERVLHGRDVSAYLIRNHGLYGWGCDMAEAERVVEATEMMLSCEMHQMQIERGRAS